MTYADTTHTTTPTADFITILHAHSGIMTKRIRPGKDPESYDHAKFFTAAVMPVNGLDDTQALLERLRPCPPRCAVRGDLINPAKRKRIVRKSNGPDATLKSAAHYWIVLDMDKVPLPESVDPTDLKACALIAISHLPSEFHNVECLAAATGSHGIKPGARLRLWFWGSRPTDDITLKAWLADYPVDRSIYKPVQPIYVADPVFDDGAEEHLPQRLIRLWEDGWARVLQVPAEICIPGSNRTVGSSDGGSDLADIPDIASALDEIPPVGPNGTTAEWDTWINVGLGCFGASGGTAEAFEEWVRWCTDHASLEECEEAWGRIQTSPPTAGWGILRTRAKTANPRWWPPSDQFDAVEFTDADKQRLEKMADDIALALEALDDEEEGYGAKKWSLEGWAEGVARTLRVHAGNQEEVDEGGEEAATADEEAATADEGGETNAEPEPDAKADQPEPDAKEPETDADANTERKAPVSDFWHTLRPVPFDVGVLPAALRDTVKDRARMMGAHPCALAWAMLSACSAAIDGQIRLQMKMHDPFYVKAALWVALVGKSSAMKTPIINTAWGPLEDVQAADMARASAEHRHWAALGKEEQKAVPEPPHARRLVTNDSTSEAIQVILARQDRGLGYLCDELTSFIGGMDRYNGGSKGGASADRGFFLKSYNGGKHTADRVVRNCGPINNLHLTICGGIQPERLATLRDVAIDGLWQRFIPIIVPRHDMGLDEKPTGAMTAYKRLIDKLLTLDPATVLHFSPEAQEVRKRAERDARNMEDAEPLGSSFGSFCGKLHGLFGRIALVLHCIEQSTSHPGDDFADDDSASLGDLVSVPNATISKEIAEAAYYLVFSSVLPNAIRVYTTMSGSDAGSIEASKDIAGFILSKHKSRILASELARDVGSCRHKTLPQVHQMVSPLVAAGWLTPESDFPTNKAWKVREAVHTDFAERAKLERERRALVTKLFADQARGERGAPPCATRH